jgi:tripartite-type tricarboxylate transporter receptor subunit TctC
MEENGMKRFLFILVSLVLTASLFGAAQQQGGGQKFPTRQVRLVVQAGAGGSSDVNCRTIAPGVEKALGVPVVVENRPGGGGGVALSWGAAQPPDGYVVLHTPVDITMLKPAGSADVTPDEFDLICRVAYHGAAIAVKSDSKYRTYQEFINDAKARPDQITVGNSGIGVAWHIAAVQLEDITGAKFSHIPFEGAAPAVTALLGGHLDAVICSPMETGPQVQGGDLRLLALFYEERMSLFPEVPTLKELGVDLTNLTWLGFGVPKGTPKETFDTLVAAFKASYDSQTYQDMLKNRGLEPGWMGPEDFTAFVKSEYNKYSELIPRVLK